MICYRDKTFCPFYEDCGKSHDCDRPLTPEVQAQADDFGLQVAMWTEKPQCHTDFVEEKC